MNPFEVLLDNVFNPFEEGSSVYAGKENEDPNRGKADQSKAVPHPNHDNSGWTLVKNKGNRGNESPSFTNEDASFEAQLNHVDQMQLDNMCPIQAQDEDLESVPNTQVQMEDTGTPPPPTIVPKRKELPRSVLAVKKPTKNSRK
ncbi:hypothetical protein KP509_13G070900 [Ceratopteris richardii]|uniref:Uncharacterized protein n=1 Tax=Ceratopteris richardii TaxID=49495 RepID=A0A8T2TGF7_CERRI|nr:hypothetical protein KP509_13G070900 [Ceratopteris richardii]